MWRELIQIWAADVEYPTEIVFALGASQEHIQALEEAFLMTLLKDLKALLAETNGISDHYGLGIVWSVEEILQYNKEMRVFPIYQEIYKSFTELLFFADAGNGDRFALPIFQGEVQPGPVLAWDHEDDTRKEVASSLQSFLEEWLNGHIHI